MRLHPLLPRLRAARRGEPLIGTLSDEERPRTLHEAYAIAAALTKSAVTVGYKVGATSEKGRKLLSLEAPFFGRIAARTLHRSPATLRLKGRPIAIEAEVGCEIGLDLPPRNATYTRAEVAAAVRRVVPVLELNVPSFEAPFVAGGLCLIADNGVNAGAVIGAPGSVGLDSISHARTTVQVDGCLIQEAAVAQPPDDPLSMVLWLANALSAQGEGLRSGQIIATGALIAPIEIRGECTVDADFAALGSVQAIFVA